MQAIRIIEDDHRALAAVLHGMRYLVREIAERGAAPRFDVLGAMIYYIDAFPERVHHPRESEYLFRFLRARCKEAAPILDVLEEEHRAGAEHVRRLGASARALPGRRRGRISGIRSRRGKLRDVRARAHAPRGARHHAARQGAPPFRADWEVIDAAFAGGAVPLFNPSDSTEEYAKLFDRIVMLAPPPIGVGPAD